MLRRVIALFLAAHGVAHLVGFMGAFQLGDFAGREVGTSLLWGQIEIGLPAAQVLGIGWLVLAVAFGIVAVSTWREARHAVAGLVVVALASLALTILASPAAIIGLAVNVLLLGGLLVRSLLVPQGSEVRPTPFSGPMAGVH